MSAAPDFSEYRAKRERLRAILQTWERIDLRDCIMESFWDTNAMIDYILDEDLLGDEIDNIIQSDENEKRIARGEEPEEPKRLCLGAETPAQERSLYERAMRGEL